MAICTVRKLSQLGTNLVLAPERYDPRRVVTLTDESESVVRMSEIVKTVRLTVSPAAASPGSYLILDTSHARDGIVISDRGLVTSDEIGSAKKTIEPGDVIISRLRPYLRQVAFVDSEIRFYGSKTTILCSTEFFVIRSADMESIAFLVPFLLSQNVQQVLAAAQEGGHHPRFDELTLLGLPVPPVLIQNRKEISQRVKESVALFRRSEREMLTLIRSAESIATTV